MPSPLTLILLAPFDGWIVGLAEVPDPVFAERMMGDGVAIDPLSGILCAPCDGEVVQLHPARHAITLRAANGAEILMHIGLDTVALGGQGFTAHVVDGQRVRAGDRLISVDLDRVGEAAKSLVTPLIITNGDDFILEAATVGRRVALGDALFTLRGARSQSRPASSDVPFLRRPVVVPLAHGLHARPAGRLAALAKNFAAELLIEAGDRRVSLLSPVRVMGLGLAKGAEATLLARGDAAEDALAALAALIESGMGERTEPDHAKPAMTQVGVEAGVITGVRAAPGLRLGIATRLQLAEIVLSDQNDGAAAESAKLVTALAAVSGRMPAGGGEIGAVMAAHRAFLDDPALQESAQSAIAAGATAGAAWHQAISEQTAILEQLDDARFRERVADLRDIERQVLLALGGQPATAATVLPERAILLAEDLLPSQLVGLDPAGLAGIVTAAGGPTSHVAILAASMNIPALVACGRAVLEIPDGAELLLDADRGRLTIAPDEATATASAAEIARRDHRDQVARTDAVRLCHTKDGVRIEIAANLGSLAEAERAVAAGAEGCGLLRTEFLFLDRQAPPDEAEQAEVYGNIARALKGRPLIIRTLDIGGDKPADYLPIPVEENPALGLRGVRVSLWRPELLRTQLRAILRAVPAAQCRIMLPMIANLAELRAVRAMVEDCKAELALTDRVALGVMVETPAAAVTADLLAAEADFLSIGTNDLTQYCLAMDRGNALVAAGIDALHPAVLRLIAETAKGAAQHRRWTGVCGGLASDIAAAPILIGLGISELSATLGQIPALKASIRDLTLERCRDLAQRALALGSAAEVRAMLAGEA